MLFHATSSLAIVALAGLATAELVPKPYKLKPAKMSVRDMFGLERRQDDNGYQPTQTFCGTGTTCAEACGAGFEQCASKDDSIHCFNPTAMQNCCGTGTGDSCDSGYFCSSDTAGATWCCPNGKSVEDCAKAYNVTDGLTSDTPVAATLTSSSAEGIPTTSSASAPPVIISSLFSSSSNEPIISSASSDYYSPSASSSAGCTTSEIVHTVVPTPASTSANTTFVSPTNSSPSATSTKPSQAGAGSHVPGSVFALLGAITFAAFL